MPRPAEVALYQTVPMMVYVDRLACCRKNFLSCSSNGQEELWRDTNPEESSDQAQLLLLLQLSTRFGAVVGCLFGWAPGSTGEGPRFL